MEEEIEERIVNMIPSEVDYLNSDITRDELEECSKEKLIEIVLEMQKDLKELFEDSLHYEETHPLYYK